MFKKKRVKLLLIITKKKKVAKFIKKLFIKYILKIIITIIK